MKQRERNNAILFKALNEKDWDNFLEASNEIIDTAWNALGLYKSLGNDLKDDAFQECKLKILKVAKKIKTESANISGYIYRVCYFKLLNFRQKQFDVLNVEGPTPVLKNDKTGDEFEFEFPYDDKLEPFLDLQVVKDHLSTYKSKKFQKAVEYYLSGYTKKEAAQKAGMWSVGCANAIDVFFLRVKNILEDANIDEQTYIKENIRPQFWTYVKDKTKRSKQ
jgi:DNA-directed RNA polymerase specialized sigma24 family protein